MTGNGKVPKLKPGILLLPQPTNGEKWGIDDFAAKKNWDASEFNSFIYPMHEVFDEAGKFVAYERGLLFSSPRNPVSGNDENKNLNLLPVLTVAEFLTEAPESYDWIAQDITAKGAVTKFAGKAKESGKTTFLMCLVSDVLNGTPFLGSPTKKSRVLFMSEQAANLREALKDAGIDDPEVEGLILLPAHLVSHLDWKELMRMVRTFCVTEEIDLLVIDTLVDFSDVEDSEENSSGKVKGTIKPLKNLAQSHDVAVVFTQHHNLENRGRGSTQFDAEPDILIDLFAPDQVSGDLDRNMRQLKAKGRGVDYKRLVKFTKEDGYEACDPTDETLSELNRSAKTVLRFLPALEIEARTLNELVEMLEKVGKAMSRATVDRGVNDLMKESLAAEKGEGVKGNPKRFWRCLPPHAKTKNNNKIDTEDTNLFSSFPETGCAGDENKNKPADNVTPIRPDVALESKQNKTKKEVEEPHTPTGLITESDRVFEAVEHVVTADVVGLDIETTGLDAFRDKVRLLQVARSDGTVYVLDADEVDITPVVRALNEVPKVLAHNMKFEASFLKPYGFNLGSNTYCTQLLYQVLTAGETAESSLKTVAKRILGVELDKTHQTADWSSEAEITPEMVEYAAKDASVLPNIYEELTRRLEKAGNLRRTIELEMQTLKATVEMTRSGLPATEEKLKAYIEESREAIYTLVAEMDSFIAEDVPEEFAERNCKNKAISETRHGNVNWQSTEQIAWAFSTLDVKLPLTKKGRPSTSKIALESVDHPLAEKVLDLNKLKTIPTKWQNALEHRYADGRLFADWKQIGAASGRYSCAKPPLQGIPKSGRARSCFEAPPGYKFVSSDLSQIEVRIWAAISEDETLIADFDRDGLDLYRSVGERLFGREVTEDERSAMKAVVLGRIYGMGARTMQERLQRALGRRVPDKEVRGYIAELESAYPIAEKWRASQETKDPDAVTNTRTMHGRLRRNVTSNPQRFNTPIQGTAADVMKAIAVSVVEEIIDPNQDVELCALIHDEVVLLVPENLAQNTAELLTTVMERVGDTEVNGDAPPELRVPIKADTCVVHSLGDKS